MYHLFNSLEEHGFETNIQNFPIPHYKIMSGQTSQKIHDFILEYFLTI